METIQPIGGGPDLDRRPSRAQPSRVELIAALVLLATLVIGATVFGVTLSLFSYLVSGLIVGGLARLVLPGRESVGLLGTSLVGLAGGAIGGFAGRALHVGQLMELVLSVAAAAVLLTALGLRERARA
jgi:uncharacterized membrane protein YeaQ/YmgE (transglycosylase-associated protein family)